MSDAEEETPQVATSAPAPGEPMDVNTAVQLVLKKALAHDGVARGLNETARALEKGEAQLAILADDCNQPDYKKLVEALCKEHGTPLLSVPEAKQLGQWAGLCKIDAEGEARRVVGCSSIVITDYGEETDGLAILQQHLKVKATGHNDLTAVRPASEPCESRHLHLKVKVSQSLDECPELLDVRLTQDEEVPSAYLRITGLAAEREKADLYAALLQQLNGFRQASKEDEMENDENQADIEEGKDVEGIKKEVKEADEVDKDKQVVRTQFLEEREREEQNSQEDSLRSERVLEGTPAAVNSQEYDVRIIHDIREVSSNEWDHVAVSSEGLNPFVLHGFLAALESSYSAVAETGWTPHHLIVQDSLTSQLIGCCPMYLKRHSQGEYIFDHSWAGVAMRLGQGYYPKLQSCVPFSPVGGPRFMVKHGVDNKAVTTAMAKAIIDITDRFGISGTHITFNNDEEWSSLSDLGFLQRTGVQYHWENKGYCTFEEFLASLKQAKRKNIRQERKFVHGAGLNIRRLSGMDLKPSHWDSFFQFYMNTCSHKWGRPYLTREFFHEMGDTMAEHVLLAVAQEGDQHSPLIAAALNLVGSEAIYGRNWGCAYDCDVKHLHFELCYYQAQEFAIERGLKRVEAGAQGEHKIQRGYLPARTYSSHYIRDPILKSIIERHLDSERGHIEYTLDKLSALYSPYKKAPIQEPYNEQVS